MRLRNPHVRYVVVDGVELPVISGGDGSGTTVPTLRDMLNDQLRAVLTRRDAAQSELDLVVNAAAQRNAALPSEHRAGLTADETTRFDEIRTRIAEIDGERAGLEARLAEQDAQEAARAAAAAASQRLGNDPRVTVGREPRQYDGPAGAGAYLRDLALGHLRGDLGARERLHRHAEQMRTDARVVAEQRAVGRTTDAELGYFVPPLYAIEDFAGVARAGRVLADAIGARPLPDGIDAVKIPRITTGTLTAVQNGDKAAITTRDVVSAETTASLVTIGGYIDVAVQAIDRAPIDVTDLLFGDLEADYAFQLDTQLWSGSGTNNQHIGLLNLEGTTSVTYTDATPTVGELLGQVGAAVSQVSTGRKLPPEVVFMAPRRWYWAASRVDSSGRPLMGFSDSFPQNVVGIGADVAAEGRAGTFAGLPTLIDQAVPTTLGSGTNEDRLLVARLSDMRLWEGIPRMSVVEVADASAENLLVRLKLWRYSIFLPGRYPTGVGIISGTGLATPTF